MLIYTWWPKYHVWIPLSYKLWSSQTHVYYMYVYLSSYLFIHDTYLYIVTQFIHIVEAIFIITILNQLFYVFIIHFFFVNNHSILSIPNQIQIILLCGKVYFNMHDTYTSMPCMYTGKIHFLKISIRLM